MLLSEIFPPYQLIEITGPGHNNYQSIYHKFVRTNAKKNYNQDICNSYSGVGLPAEKDGWF